MEIEAGLRLLEQLESARSPSTFPAKLAAAATRVHPAQTRGYKFQLTLAYHPNTLKKYQ